MTLEDNLDIFHKNGFEFEIEEEASRGGGRVKLVAVPMSKDWNFGPSDVEEMLFMMAELNPGQCSGKCDLTKNDDDFGLKLNHVERFFKMRSRISIR